MNAGVFLSLALSLLGSVLAAAKVGGVSQEIIANLEAAIASLLAVQGQDVTYEQFESLRVEPKW